VNLQIFIDKTFKYVIMKNLVLLRGLPGAGKSTLAAILSEDKYPVFSVDDFFTDKQTKEYRFEFDKNHLAYQQCESNTKNAMIKESPKIFVDNVFTLAWELEPYFKLASQFNYSLFVLTVEKYHSNKNIHNVNEEQLQKMASKYKVKLL
jgi:predicted kinase